MSSGPRELLSTLLESLSAASKAKQQKRCERRLQQRDATHSKGRPTRSAERRSTKDLPDEAKNAFLTLHVLFPHILLDALDLLDRGCVVKVYIQDRDTPTSILDQGPSAEPRLPIDPDLHHVTHYVLSTRSRHAPRDRLSISSDTRRTHPTSQFNSSQAANQTEKADTSLEDAEKYQVHLKAWNCSCPAFALAAYSTPTTSARASPSEQGDKFCGLSLRQRQATDGAEGLQLMPPICKHLMACMLSDVAPELFGPFEKGDAEPDGSAVGGETGLAGWEEQEESDGRGAKRVVVGILAAAGLAAGV